MTERLKAICSLIEPCPLLMDVGCDHGYVARYALDNGVERVIASDVSKGSLKKAENTLKGYGERAELRLGDGLKTLRANEKPNIIVLAGMGGRLIWDIIKDSVTDCAFIIGAQRDLEFLRERLVGNGYKLTHDFVVGERGKYYDIIRAVKGQMTLDALQLKMGAHWKKPNAMLEAKCEKELVRLSRYGADASYITEVLEWQQQLKER